MALPVLASVPQRMIARFIKALREKQGMTFDASIVLGGTVVAQFLPLLLYPLFTRLFDPAAFGTFATITLFATPLAVIASGIYEQAFLIAKNDRAALTLFQLLLFRSAVVLSASMMLLLVFRHSIAEIFDDPTLISMLLLVPAISLGQIFYNSTSEWLVRQKAFTSLAGNRVWQSTALAIPKLGFGLATATNGLVWGEAAGRILYISYNYVFVWRAAFRTHGLNSWHRMKVVGQRYRSFPRFMVPDQLLNTFGGSIHVLLIGAAFGPTQLGYISLLFSALYLPVTVISSSVKDVFRQRASVDYFERGTCRPLYLQLLGPIALVGLLGFGALYLMSPWFFPFAFGSAWAPLGGYAQILIPMFFFNFVSMSLGGVLVIANRMKVSLHWQIINLALALIALLVGIHFIGTVPGTLMLLSFARSLSYLHYMLLSYKYAKAG